jgi:hypothetical protein
LLSTNSAAPEFIELVFRDPARGASWRFGRISQCSARQSDLIRFARAMGPFMAPDAKMVAEFASDPHQKVLDISASHVSLASLANAFRSAT